MSLKPSEVFALSQRRKIIVHFNELGQPDEGHLLQSFIGRLATNALMFSIDHDSWHTMDQRRRDECWTKIISVIF